VLAIKAPIDPPHLGHLCALLDAVNYHSWWGRGSVFRLNLELHKAGLAGNRRSERRINEADGAPPSSFYVVCSFGGGSDGLGAAGDKIWSRQRGPLLREADQADEVR
jgi:hypothetical protein